MPVWTASSIITSFDINSNLFKQHWQKLRQVDAPFFPEMLFLYFVVGIFIATSSDSFNPILIYKALFC